MNRHLVQQNHVQEVVNLFVSLRHVRQLHIWYKLHHGSITRLKPILIHEVEIALPASSHIYPNVPYLWSAKP